MLNIQNDKAIKAGVHDSGVITSSICLHANTFCQLMRV